AVRPGARAPVPAGTTVPRMVAFAGRDVPQCTSTGARVLMKNSIAVSLVVLLSAMGISACGGSRSVRDTETRAPTIITDADGNTEQIETTRSLTTHTVVLEMPME